MDSGARLWLKAIIWQATGLALMLIVGYAFTGSFVLGGSIALFNMAIGLVAYVLYERIWAQVRWGRFSGGRK